VIVVIASIALGILNFSFAILFALTAFGYGICLSCAAITLEEFTFRRYHRWRDLGSGIAAAIVENLGCRDQAAAVRASWK
jgi:hypothetical protein